MTTLDTVRAEVQAWDESRPRSLQVEIGASGIYACRAATYLRLSEVPPTDPRLSWQAVVGTAIHAVLEAAAQPPVLTEYRVTYRGIPCTIDRYDPRTRTLIDFKTKDDAGAIASARRYGINTEKAAQLHIGAAALIEAGHPVDTVEFLFLPRAGDSDSAWSWSAPFDREQADAAVDWALEQTLALPVRHAQDDPLEGLRDEPERFCRSYCPWVTHCRGPEREIPVLDDPTLPPLVEEYVAGKALEQEGKARADAARRDLLGVSGVVGEWKVSTSGGNAKVREEVDVDAMLATYREWIGPLPMRTVESTSALSLRVVKAP